MKRIIEKPWVLKREKAEEWSALMLETGYNSWGISYQTLKPIEIFEPFTERTWKKLLKENPSGLTKEELRCFFVSSNIQQTSLSPTVVIKNAQIPVHLPQVQPQKDFFPPIEEEELYEYLIEGLKEFEKVFPESVYKYTDNAAFYDKTVRSALIFQALQSALSVVTLKMKGFWNDKTGLDDLLLDLNLRIVVCYIIMEGNFNKAMQCILEALQLNKHESYNRHFKTIRMYRIKAVLHIGLRQYQEARGVVLRAKMLSLGGIRANNISSKLKWAFKIDEFDKLEKVFFYPSNELGSFHGQNQDGLFPDIYIGEYLEIGILQQQILEAERTQTVLPIFGVMPNE